MGRNSALDIRNQLGRGDLSSAASARAIDFSAGNPAQETMFRSRSSSVILPPPFARHSAAISAIRLPASDIPGSVWDVSNPARRALNACIVEDNNLGAADHVWNPSANGSSPIYGKREYLFVMNSDYDGSGLTYAGFNIINDASRWTPLRLVAAGRSRTRHCSVLSRPHCTSIPTT